MHPWQEKASRTRRRCRSWKLWLKHDLQLNPHTADAAVGEVAVEKASRWSAHHVFRRNLSELRMVQGIEGFPAKLQPPLLSDREGLGQGQVEVVHRLSRTRTDSWRPAIGYVEEENRFVENRSRDAIS